MFSRLEDLKIEFSKITEQVQDSSIVQDKKKYSELMRRFSELENLLSVYKQYTEVTESIKSNIQLLSAEKEEEMRALIKQDNVELEKKKIILVEELKLLLLSKDPNDDKNVILEIRAGAGGDEASLFAEELFRAYNLCASGKKWKIEVMSLSEGNSGGLKEVIASISGSGVYSFLKYESGVHRVQRVPKTESQGRVHTSTITVAILPEATAVDININSNDLRVDVYRSSGNGGQSVNTTDSAVRITHIPTGVVVTCQDGKSQHSNKDKALKVLYSRLKQAEEEKANKEASDQRLSLIGTGDRSERIRTYNFPQMRITDHRIGLTVHKLNDVINGDFNCLVEPLITYFQAERLKSQ
ncbi:MAG: peptide chain release factor 1 [Bdellovibrionaceae bacterium]|nr:peptide chain release factor 1 [Pseudobdellovibrionaceae bacterium]